MFSFFALIFGGLPDLSEEGIDSPLSPHKEACSRGFSGVSGQSRACMERGFSPDGSFSRIWGREGFHRSSELPLEEPSGDFPLPKEGFDLLLADVREEELEPIAGDEEDERHRFGCVEVVGIEVLGVDQAIEGLEPIVFDIPAPVCQGHRQANGPVPSFPLRSVPPGW